MTATEIDRTATELDELRQQKIVFDNTWLLSAALAVGLIVLCWYFRFAQVDVAPVIWTLAGLVVTQSLINTQSDRANSRLRLSWLVFSSQMLGTVLIGIAWHMFGGAQQPLFPLLILLPLIPGALLLSFWQQLAVILAFLGTLMSALLLSPDSNSFIEERYGLGVTQLLPHWIPRSHVVFAAVNTTPIFDLVSIATVAVIALAVSSSARALGAVCRRSIERVRTLERDLLRQQRVSEQLVHRAPCAEVLVASMSGRIVGASDRFTRAFGIRESVIGRFLLDAVSFAYPSVIKRLIETGGEELQAATLNGRDIFLYVRAEVLDSDGGQLTVFSIEPHDALCWRGEADALEEPTFAVSARGSVVSVNRAARALFGDNAEGGPAVELFGAAAGHWWSIAPLEVTRRILERNGQRYLAWIRRDKVAPSLGELTFIRLYGYAPVARVGQPA